MLVLIILWQYSGGNDWMVVGHSRNQDWNDWDAFYIVKYCWYEKKLSHSTIAGMRRNRVMVLIARSKRDSNLLWDFNFSTTKKGSEKTAEISWRIHFSMCFCFAKKKRQRLIDLCLHSLRVWWFHSWSAFDKSFTEPYPYQLLFVINNSITECCSRLRNDSEEAS